MQRTATRESIGDIGRSEMSFQLGLIEADQSDNDSVNVATARNRWFQFRRDPPLTFNRLFVGASFGPMGDNSEPDYLSAFPDGECGSFIY